MLLYTCVLSKVSDKLGPAALDIVLENKASSSVSDSPDYGMLSTRD